MRLENRGCSIPPEINSYVPLPHVFLLVFIPHSYFFPLLLIQQTTLKFLFQGKDNCGWKEQLTPGILHVSFSNHWHRKLFVRTFVPYYRQQSLFFLVHFPNNFQRWEEERDSSGWKASWLHVFLCAEFGHVLRCRVVPSVLWAPPQKQLIVVVLKAILQEMNSTYHLHVIPASLQQHDPPWDHQ